MTLSELPDGTHVFTPGTPNSGVDRFGIARPQQYQGQQSALRKNPPTILAVPGEDNLFWFDILVEDLRGGLYKYDRGPWSLVQNYLLSSSAETRRPGFMHNPLALTLDGLPPVTSDDYSLHWCVYGGRMIVAVGQMENDYTYLYKEALGSSGGLTQMTFNKGSNHTFLTATPITFNSIQYLILGYYIAASEAITDVSGSVPTSAGSMHADTGGMFWIVQTDREDSWVVANCLGTIVSWTRDAAFSDAPTIVEDGLPIGGYLVGLMSLNGGSNRIVYVRPFDQDVGLAVQPGLRRGTGLEFVGGVFWRDMRGQDEQQLTRRFGLKYVTKAIPVRGGVLATDKYQANWINGIEFREFKLFDNAPADPTIERHIMDFWSPDDNHVYFEINEVSANGSGAVTSRYTLRYDWDLDAVTAVDSGAGFGTPDQGEVSYQSGNGPGLPVSPFSYQLYSRAGGNWFRQYQPPNEQNPYQLRQVSGAPAGLGSPFAIGWEAVSPEFWLDGYEGCEYFVSRIIGPSIDNIQEGGALAADGGALDASLRIFCGGLEFNANASEPDDRWPKLTFLDENWVPTLQWQAIGQSTQTDTDSANYAINGAPFRIQGYIRRPIGVPVPIDKEALE